MRLAYHFGKKMQERKRGAIALCSSMASLGGMPGNGVYSAAKAFMNTLCEVMWYELGKHGVDVCSIVIPGVKTPAMVRMGARFDENSSEPSDIADEILASSQTLTELPLPNEQAIAPYSTHGSERGRINIIGIGTNKNIAIEATHLLKQQQISAKYTHLSHWQEYEPEIKTDLEKAAITFFLSPLRQPSSSFPNAASIDVGSQAQTNATKLSSLLIKKLKEARLA